MRDLTPINRPIEDIWAYEHEYMKGKKIASYVMNEINRKIEEGYVITQLEHKENGHNWMVMNATAVKMVEDKGNTLKLKK